MKFLWYLVFSFKLCLILGQEEGPIVTIPDGRLRGAIRQTVGANISYYSFRGIPFAKEPVGNLRFANPVKNDPWTGTYDATQDKDPCTQPSSNVIGSPGGAIIGSEDCLHINVYSTDLIFLFCTDDGSFFRGPFSTGDERTFEKVATQLWSKVDQNIVKKKKNIYPTSFPKRLYAMLQLNGSLPVMVWIYGGGFTGGTSAYIPYAPDYIIEKDVVFVSLNYRLGVFGFLSTEDPACYGNWGLKDQVLALKWVQNNVQYFGGDPTKVTIFGQSAGSASVSYLVQSNQTPGLFSGAIMQSGSSLCLWALTRNARRKAFSVGLNLGIFTLNAQTLITNLRKVDYKALSIAEGNVTSAALLTDSILAGLPFGVVKEQVHPDAIFSGRSYELLKNGEFHKIPLIIGYTSNEGAALQAYVNAARPAFLPYDLDPTRLAPYDLTTNYLRKVAANIAIRGRYFKLGVVASSPANVTKFVTVDQFNRPVHEAVRRMSAYIKVYYYRFSYEGLLGNPNSSYTGVGHADDLFYLFSSTRSSSSEDRLTRDRCVTLWTNFAKTGDPSSTGSSNTSLGNLIWVPNIPGDDTTTAIKYLNIDKNLTMGTNPDQPDWAFYERIYERYGNPPYATY